MNPHDLLVDDPPAGGDIAEADMHEVPTMPMSARIAAGVYFLVVAAILVAAGAVAYHAPMRDVVAFAVPTAIFFALAAAGAAISSRLEAGGGRPR